MAGTFLRVSTGAHTGYPHRSCLEWVRSEEAEDLLLEVQLAMKAIEEMRQARARDTIVALLLPGAHSDLDGGCWDPLHRWYTKTLLSSRPAAAERALRAIAAIGDCTFNMEPPLCISSGVSPWQLECSRVRG